LLILELAYCLSEPGFSGLSDFQDLPRQGFLIFVYTLFWNSILVLSEPGFSGFTDFQD